MREHGKPEVFNSAQGAQFTSKAFTDVLKREGVNIRMDGRGRALDNSFVERLWRNVKREDVYLKGYANMAAPKKENRKQYECTASVGAATGEKTSSGTRIKKKV